MRTASIIVAIAATLLLVLISCGQQGDPHSKGAGIVIKALNWGTEEENKVWQQLAVSFEAKTGIKVEVETAEWTVYWEKINTLFAAHTPPEVFAMDAPLFRDWYSRGALVSLQSYIDREPGFLDGLNPLATKAYQTDQGYFGLPRDFQTIVLFYNKDMFDKAGIPYPNEDWTIQDLRETAKKLTLKDSTGKITQWGFTADLYDIEGFMSEMVWNHGGEILNPEHSKTLLADNTAPWKFIAEMVQVDKSLPDVDTQGQYGFDMFQAGKAAMITIGHWAVPSYATTNFRWDVAPFPKGPAGRATSINSAGFVMSKGAKNLDAGWQWIQYVLSDEGQTKLAQLGFAIPVRTSIAESPAFLDQPIKINQKIFLDAIGYAHMKPVFKGYDAWSAAFGDAMSSIWKPDAQIETIMKTAVQSANDSLTAH